MLQTKVTNITLDKAKHVFIVGIKGVAMANMAIILRKIGKQVSGFEVDGSFITDALIAKHRIPFTTQLNPTFLPPNTDVVIYAASHGGANNLFVAEAKKRHITVISQSEALEAIFSRCAIKIAVCGTHGKTTTSSLMAHVLIQLGLQPSYLVGAPQFGKYWGGDFLKRDYCVIEADEYGISPPYDLTPKFYYLNPDYTIATNIDFDHADVYHNLDAVKKAFLDFFQKKRVKKIIACRDDNNLNTVLKSISGDKIITYGFSKTADLVLQPLSYNHFSAVFKGHPIGAFSFPLWGDHNVLNVGGVILLSLELGLDIAKVRSALASFAGAKRRCELVFQLHDIFLFDDYAHHPTEIEATINALRQQFPKNRIVVIFQPHTFSRTFVFKSAFAKALSKADVAIVTDIYPSAREKKEQFPVTALDIEKNAALHHTAHVTYQPQRDIVNFLSKNIKTGDIICIMGAGDIYQLKNDIIDLLCQNGKK